MTEPIWQELERLLLPDESGPDRYPIKRHGERAEIPGFVRLAVWLRDQGRCEVCGFQPVRGPYHLDHMLPWSAGGSDRSSNLRVLCEEHNMSRSNLLDHADSRPRRPVTWWCIHCFGAQTDPDNFWQWYDDGRPWHCPTHQSNFHACRVMRAFNRAMVEGVNQLGDWHRRGPIEDDDGLVVAYCAHCDAPALTSYPL